MLRLFTKSDIFRELFSYCTLVESQKNTILQPQIGMAKNRSYNICRSSQDKIKAMFVRNNSMCSDCSQNVIFSDKVSYCTLVEHDFATSRRDCTRTFHA